MDPLESELEHLLKQMAQAKECQRDALRERMDALAVQIRQRYVSDPSHTSERLREVYALVTGEALGPTPKQVSQPALYEDPYQLFPQRTASLKWVAFEEHLPSQGSNAMERLKAWMSDPSRGQTLETLGQELCEECQKEVLPELFYRVCAMVIVDLKRQSDLIRVWVQEKKITVLQAKRLLHWMADAMKKLLRMMDRVKREGAKVKDVEQVYLVTVRLTNEVLFAWVSTDQLKKSVLGA